MTSRAAAPVALPRLDHPDARLVTFADQLVRAIQAEFQRVTAPGGPSAYVLSNVSAANVSRTFDPTTATTTDLAKTLAALLLDLKNKGSIA